ncbi:hypothetical protein [Henriciella litoralis]|uniref:hypothetical protein n=1 Tax=Henriciella litoralis TaxID=568102 RepID=UPI00111BF55B|nr:hypothetical protein [Henriciella litoralis]
MKSRLFAALAATFILGACESMYEPILLERQTISNEQGIYVYGDLEEGFEGDRFWNFYATNNNAFPVCVGLTLGAGSNTSGHSFDGVHRIEPGDTEGVGYLYLPASYTLETGAWNPDDYGSCD